MKKFNKKDQLKVEIKDNQVVISVGIDLLCFAVSGEIMDYQIIDNEGFVKDMIRELEREEEDGTTPIYRMFDKAANEAIENGSLHVDEITYG